MRRDRTRTKRTDADGTRRRLGRVRGLFFRGFTGGRWGGDADAGDEWDGVEFERGVERIGTGGVDDVGVGWTGGARRGVGDANEKDERKRRVEGVVGAGFFVRGRDGARG